MAKTVSEGSANKAIPISADFSWSGAHAVLRFSGKAKTAPTRWAAELLVKKPYNVVAVALANKMARIVWAFDDDGQTL